jgi:hypothetical protein
MKIRRAVPTVASGSSLVLAVVLLSACSPSSNDRTPTQPENLSLGTASVAGRIDSSGAPAKGIRIGVDGLSTSAVSDSRGHFELAGIAAGDRLFHFESSAGSSSATLSGVRAGEHVVVTVELKGSSAQFTSVTHSSNGGNDPSGGGNSGQPDTGALRVDASPGTWDLCSLESNGNLNLLVRGEGFKDIDPTSLLLAGDDGAATPIAPESAKIEGEHLKARFARKDAVALLLQPLAAGETRTFTLSFLQLGAPASLSFDVDLVQEELTCTDDDDSLDED